MPRSVTVNDFGGGAKSLQALVGSVDVVSGAYEHTIRMQNRGQDIKAICELGQFPGICIAVRKDLAGEIKTIADLKGQNVGVTAPGSSTSLFLQYALIKNGLSADDASIIGVGGGASAVAAVKKGEIAALVHLDPGITRLEVDGDITILLDTRTEAGTRALFGGTPRRRHHLCPAKLHRRQPRHHPARGQCLCQIAELDPPGIR